MCQNDRMNDSGALFEDFKSLKSLFMQSILLLRDINAILFSLPHLGAEMEGVVNKISTLQNYNIALDKIS